MKIHSHVLDQSPDQAHNLELEEKLKAAWARIDRKAILIYRYSQMSDDQMTIWHRKHLASLKAA